MTDNSTITAKPRSKIRDVWDQFKSHKGALLGAIIFFSIVLLVMVGPFVWPFDANQIDIRSRNQGPSLLHPFGTDQLGRDTLARMMAGGRTSIAVGLAAMALSLFFGNEFCDNAVCGDFGNLNIEPWKSFFLKLLSQVLGRSLHFNLQVGRLSFKGPLSNLGDTANLVS